MPQSTKVLIEPVEHLRTYSLLLTKVFESQFVFEKPMLPKLEEVKIPLDYESS